MADKLSTYRKKRDFGKTGEPKGRPVKRRSHEPIFVIVWDTGTFRNTSHDKAGKEIPLAEAIEHGHASFFLEGKKLHGGYALNRFRKQGTRDLWLLVKESDEYAGGRLTDESVLSGRTL